MLVWLGGLDFEPCGLLLKKSGAFHFHLNDGSFAAMVSPCRGQETPLSEGGNSTGGGLGLPPDSFQKLCSVIGSLISIPDEEFSDLTVIVEGRKVLVHRCILAARCPGFRKVFAEIEWNGKKREMELSSVVKEGKVGFEAFMGVMGYVYGGKVEPWPAIVECYHLSCAHLTCRPGIDYVLEILCASVVFELPDLKTLAQEHLLGSMGKFQLDDVLHVHQSVSTTGCSQLQLACLTALASSSIDNLTLEREFSGAILEQVRNMRKDLGLDGSRLTPAEEKQCKRIHRALDSDDLELVRLLLDEKKLNLNGAHALHYAAAYCHPRTLAHLLELDLADTNLRDERGMTVLHVAAWRREPHSIANLLEKGANLKDCTSDNLTALDISRRLTKKLNLDKGVIPKERLCVGILEQAAKDMVSVPLGAAAMLAEPTTEKELMSVLLYLENRVALARLLCPQEADIVCAHLDSYASIMSSSESGNSSRKRKSSVDLNEGPAQRLAGLVGVAVVEESKERRLESLRQRYIALRKATLMGRRYFPSFSAVIDEYVLDDDLMELLDEENIEAQVLKKRHFTELKGLLQDSFPDGKVSNDNGHKKRKEMRKVTVPSSSSSTSSSRGTGGSMVTTSS